MGCVQTKPSSASPPRGLEKMKAENGYVPGSTAALRPSIRAALPPRVPAKSGAAAAEAGEGKVEREREGRAAARRVAFAVPEPPQGRPDSGDPYEMVDGWPRWLVNNIPKEALAGLVPKSADSYDKLDKIGQGTYSNVYKARERDTGRIVALKKVRFDTTEPESVRFMAREIMILRKLDHPNIIKLDGLATSRMQYSIYLVFDFMRSDLSGIICRPEERLTEPQVKCYMQQLLAGLQHCHERGILHRDIKGSNILIDEHGTLKIADFGLANFFNPNRKRPLTSRVVTLWYRAPELLLGTTDYGVGIDLWSAGCLLAEMFVGKPIMPGRTEVEQLHRIFKLCGSPPEDYWKKLKLSTSFRPPRPYKPSIMEAFKDFPSSLSLLSILLALDPSYRGNSASALENEFFTTSPLACDLSGLPVIKKDEKDDSAENREKKKRRNARLRERSRTQKEGQRKTEKSIHSGPMKEEEKIADQPLRHHSHELGTARASSASESIILKRQVTSPAAGPATGPLSPPTMAVRGRPHGTEGHSAKKNAANSPPALYDDEITEVGGGGGMEGVEKIRRYGLEKRSASVSIFRRSEENQIQQPYIVVE